MTLAEELLSAWMYATSRVCNKRIVDTMSYNEAAVCKLLYEADKEITAKMLCDRLNMLKSQMNAVLNTMERKALIQKRRSDADKRKVYIDLSEQGKTAFLAEHKKNIALVEKLILRIGTERARLVTEALNDAAGLFGAL